MFDQRRVDGLVHYTTDRTYPLDRGNGDVSYEDWEVSLCDIPVGATWEEPLVVTVPVTCLRCLTEAFAFQRPSFSILGVKTGRLSASPNLGKSWRP